MAARFTKASNQWLQTVSSFTPPAEGSVSFWAKLTSFPGASARYRFVGNQTDFEIAYYDVDNTIRYQFLTTGAGAVSAADLLSLEVWHHFVGTYSTITDAVVGYLDGVQVATTTAIGGTPAAGILGIGHAIWTSEGWIDGEMDEVRTYDRVLSADEVQAIHICRGSDEIHFGLTHRWLMREGAPGVTISGVGVVKDLTHGGLNMSPNGSPVFAESVLVQRRRAA